jgi:tRNA-specific 2-thiouridylase
MDLCFLPEGGIREFFKRRGVPLEEGPIYDEEGNLLGIHEGIAGFTVGQRRGLKVSYGEPLYVKSILPETNTVIAGRRETVFKKSFSLLNFSWISGEPSESEEVEVQIRYRSKPVPALLKRGFDRWEVVLEEPVVPTPGQSAVFYRGEEVLGGGIIFG